MLTVFAYCLIGWATVWIIDYVTRYDGHDALSPDDDGFIFFIVTLWPIALTITIGYLLYSVINSLVKKWKNRKVAK